MFLYLSKCIFICDYFCDLLKTLYKVSFGLKLHISILNVCNSYKISIIILQLLVYCLLLSVSKFV